jgi:hypothetical protein
VVLRETLEQLDRGCLGGLVSSGLAVAAFAVQAPAVDREAHDPDQDDHHYGDHEHDRATAVATAVLIAFHETSDQEEQH